MSHQKNITRMKAVYNALGALKDQVVFVGGATVAEKIILRKLRYFITVGNNLKP